MESRWHGMPGAKALLALTFTLSISAGAASGGQGFLTGFPSCNGQMACGCAAGAGAGAGAYGKGAGEGAYAGDYAGDYGGANAGPGGDQFANAPFDLGEAGPAQIGENRLAGRLEAAEWIKGVWQARDEELFTDESRIAEFLLLREFARTGRDQRRDECQLPGILDLRRIGRLGQFLVLCRCALPARRYRCRYAGQHASAGPSADSQ